MKTVMDRLDFLAKASLLAGLLLSGQQALAQDTLAGTTITNQARVPGVPGRPRRPAAVLTSTPG